MHWKKAEEVSNFIEDIEDYEFLFENFSLIGCCKFDGQYKFEMIQNLHLSQRVVIWLSFRNINFHHVEDDFPQKQKTMSRKRFSIVYLLKDLQLQDIRKISLRAYIW